MPTTPFGEAPRSPRLARRLSESGLSRAGGLDGAQITRLESGERRPTLGHLIALAEAPQLGRNERIWLVEATGLPIEADR
ncbi:MAG: helix-turn-helix domain-containing protein [Chloroflexota bacterium]|nr:helix-turn-helix domain-containing protein [Chloroflexota bacterium]